MMAMNTLKRGLVICGLAAIAQAVQAEGVLIKSSPTDYAQVQDFKGEVKLWFSGNISERFPSLVVVDGNGKRVDNADLQLHIDKRSQLSVTTAPLPSGPYVIRYRVVTEDGLVVSGIQHFSVAH